MSSVMEFINKTFADTKQVDDDTGEQVTTALVQWGVLSIQLFSVVIGLIGNLLTFIVLVAGKRHRSLYHSTFTAAIAVSDFFAVIAHVLPNVLTPNSVADQLIGVSLDLPTQSWLFCRPRLYLDYVCRLSSSWLRILYVFNRTYTILRPLKKLSRSSVKWKTVALVSVITLCLVVPIYKVILVKHETTAVDFGDLFPFASNDSNSDLSLIKSSIRRFAANSRAECRNLNRPLNTALDVVYYAALVTGLPFIAITAMNFITLRAIRNSNRFRERTAGITDGAGVTRQPSTVSMMNRSRWHRLVRRHMEAVRVSNNIALSPGYAHNARLSTSSQMSRQRLKSLRTKEAKLTVQLTMGSCFILLNMPYFILRLVFLTTGINEQLGNQPNYRRPMQLTKAITYVNFAISVFVHLFTSKQFRRDIVDLFRPFVVLPLRILRSISLTHWCKATARGAKSRSLHQIGSGRTRAGLSDGSSRTTGERQYGAGRSRLRNGGGTNEMNISPTCVEAVDKSVTAETALLPSSLPANIGKSNEGTNTCGLKGSQSTPCFNNQLRHDGVVMCIKGNIKGKVDQMSTSPVCHLLINLKETRV